MNSSFDAYKVPTALDMPKIDARLVEMARPRGPFGAKTVGEPALVPTAAAIGNAIADAIGVQIRDLLITPEKILEAIRQKREAKLGVGAYGYATSFTPESATNFNCARNNSIL